ncbi:hypothetical protein PMIN04_004721 [Paraphaeosphaeria minitans]
MPNEKRELRRQNRQASRTGKIAAQLTPPLRTVQIRRTKYLVPRTPSRRGSFFAEDPLVTAGTPTVEQALSWSYERILMMKEYEQKVAAMGDDETNISTPLADNDPFAALAQSKHTSRVLFSLKNGAIDGAQDSLGKSSRTAAKFTSAVSLFAQALRPELSGIDGNTVDVIEEGVKESLRQLSQFNRVSPIYRFRRPSNHRKHPVAAEVFSTRRILVKEQLAANVVKRKEMLQQEQDEIEALKASASFEGERILEFNTATKERKERQLRLLGKELRTVQRRLIRLGHLERGGKGPIHIR